MNSTKELLIASCGNELKLHSFPSYKTIKCYNTLDASGPIRTTSWCKDGSLLAVVPYQGPTEILRCKYKYQSDCHLIQSVVGGNDATAAAFQRTALRSLALANTNGTVLLYDIKLRSIRKQFMSCGSVISYLDWNVKDSHLAAGSHDGRITIYSNSTNQKCRVITIPDSQSVSAVRFHPTIKNDLVCASDEGIIAVWDISSDNNKFYTKSHHALVSGVVFSPQNKFLLISSSLDRTFQFHDLKTKSVVLTILNEHPLSAVDISPDGCYFAVGTTLGFIIIYDIRCYNKPLKQIQAHTSAVKNISFQLYEKNEQILVPQEKGIVLRNTRCKKETELSIAQKRLVRMEKTAVDNSAVYTLENCFLMNIFKISEEHEQKESSLLPGDSFINVLSNLQSSNITNEFINEQYITDSTKTNMTHNLKKRIDSKLRPPEVELLCSSNVTADSPLICSKVISTPVTSDLVNTVETPLTSPINLSSNSSIAPPKSIEQDTCDKKLNKLLEVIDEKITEVTEHIRCALMHNNIFLVKQFMDHENQIKEKMDLFLNVDKVKPEYMKELDELRKENIYLKEKINFILSNRNILEITNNYIDNKKIEK